MADSPVILVVDNDKRIAVIMRNYLEPLGYKVVGCEDASDVPARAREASARLLLLDVLMPGLGGLEVCRQVRAAGLNLPIVMLSSQSSPKDMDLARAAGADDYFTKPVDLKDLEAALWKLLHGGAR